jgi:2',3'-cyclic-nucleotide 2'-phosphodiesterase (5'-nucleotidase family)
MKTSHSRVSFWLITAAALVALLLSVVPVATAQTGDFTLVVLHTNDVHGRVL